MITYKQIQVAGIDFDRDAGTNFRTIHNENFELSVNYNPNTNTVFCLLLAKMIASSYANNRLIFRLEYFGTGLCKAEALAVAAMSKWLHRNNKLTTWQLPDGDL